jgi:glutaconate CoA-transferase, subunit B
MTANWTRDEFMTVAAARALKNGDVCFVGIGLPSAAANLARLTHAPELVLIYESGTIATRPNVLPLSIGDGELCETADTTVGVPEMFRYWLQGGRISVGFLGGAQIDRFANLNTTVIGPYAKPKVRLPGGGGAPEIAANCGEVFIIMRQAPKAFVPKLDFQTSMGHGKGRGDPDLKRRPGKGTTRVFTDLCVMEPCEETLELEVVTLHPGTTRDEVMAATGWPVRFAARVGETEVPTAEALQALRDLQARTAKAHGSIAGAIA